MARSAAAAASTAPEFLRPWLVSKEGGEVTTVLRGGDDEASTAAGVFRDFLGPFGIAITADGSLAYVTCGTFVVRFSLLGNCKHVIIAGSKGESDVAVDGIGSAARFKHARGVALSPDETQLYVADFGGHTIRRISLEDNFRVSTVAGSGEEGSNDGVGAAASFNGPSGIVMTSDGAHLYVSDCENHTIRKISVGDFRVTTVAGKAGERGKVDGEGPSARFYFPYGLALSLCDSYLFVADYFNHSIRRVSLLENFAVTTVAGSGKHGCADGEGTAATFNCPYSLAIPACGTKLYVTDQYNHKIRCVSLLDNNRVSTLAGSGHEGNADGKGAAASFKNLLGVALAPGGS